MTATLGPPTLAGFQAFLVSIGISTQVLPSDSPYTPLAFNFALDWVNQDINTISPDLYTQCVYNFGADRIINFAPDQPGQTFFGGGPNGNPAGLRQQYGINTFQAGVIKSSADEATSQSFEVPEWASGLTLMDLQNLKTPYGKFYLQIAQQTGDLWGLT